MIAVWIISKVQPLTGMKGYKAMNCQLLPFYDEPNGNSTDMFEFDANLFDIRCALGNDENGELTALDLDRFGCPIDDDGCVDEFDTRHHPTLLSSPLSLLGDTENITHIETPIPSGVLLHKLSDEFCVQIPRDIRICEPNLCLCAGDTVLIVADTENDRVVLLRTAPTEVSPSDVKVSTQELSLDTAILALLPEGFRPQRIVVQAALSFDDGLKDFVFVSGSDGVVGRIDMENGFSEIIFDNPSLETYGMVAINRKETIDDNVIETTSLLVAANSTVINLPIIDENGTLVEDIVGHALLISETHNFIDIAVIDALTANYFADGKSDHILLLLDKRTGALLYTKRPCSDSNSLPCTDLDLITIKADLWSPQSISLVRVNWPVVVVCILETGLTGVNPQGGRIMTLTIMFQENIEDRSTYTGKLMMTSKVKLASYGQMWQDTEFLKNATLWGEYNSSLYNYTDF